MQQSRTEIMRTIRPALIILLAVVVAIIGYLLYYSTTFHIVKTNPALSDVSYASPYLKVYFNQRLASDKLSITDTYGIIQTYTISDKVITFSFKDEMSANSKYSFTVKTFRSAGNDTIENETFNFTAQDVEPKKLPKDQQKALQDAQSKFPYESTYIYYQNFDELLTAGVPQDHLDDIKSSLYDYSTVIGKQFWTMTLQPKTASVILHDRNSSDPNDSATFKVKLGQSIYTATARYNTLTEGLQQLLIADSSGAVIYDSAAAHD